MPSPFRFGVSLVSLASAEAWRKKCGEAEKLGYDVILVPDHLGMPAPFPALVAAAEATEHTRLGTFVLNSAFWNPTLLAREVTTTDTLTGGRLELGLGAGYLRAESESATPFYGTTPRKRVDHLIDTIERLDTMLNCDELSRCPKSVQSPRIPLMVGGNGDRVLRLAAKYADIAAFAGARTVPGSVTGRLVPLKAEDLDERIARYQWFAAGRGEAAELNLMIQSVVITNHRERVIRPFLKQMPHLTTGQALELPIFLTGTLRQIIGQVRERRDRYGFSYFAVLERHMREFAPVVSELRGR